MLWVSVWGGGRAWGSIDALFPKLPPNIGEIEVNIPFDCPAFDQGQLFLLSTPPRDKVEEGLEKALRLRQVTFKIIDTTGTRMDCVQLKKDVCKTLRRIVEDKFPRATERKLVVFESNLFPSSEKW